MPALQELVLTVCLLSAPADCRQERIAFDYESGPLACIMTGHLIVAEWAKAHPKRRVMRWECERPGKRAVRA